MVAIPKETGILLYSAIFCIPYWLNFAASKKNNAMNILLWIAQGIAGAMFILAGAMKSTQPLEKLSGQMSWINDFSTGMVRFVGISELLGGIGLVLPWATGIVPVLTPLSGAALAVVMIAAAIYHVRKKEMKAIGMNIFLFALTVFVAYGRFISL